MLINGVAESTYKAKLLKYTIQPASVTTYDAWLRNADNPLYLGRQITYKTISCRFVIEGGTNNECMYQTSKLVNALRDSILKFDDLDFYYPSLLQSFYTEALIEDGYFTLSADFKSAYSYLPEITETMSGITSKSITILGDLTTVPVIIVTTPANMASVILGGFGKDNITIKNLLADIPVIIDGEKRIATQEGINKFSDIDMWEFPKLNPGVNIITTDHSSCNVTFSYKPKFN